MSVQILLVASLVTLSLVTLACASQVSSRLEKEELITPSKNFPNEYHVNVSRLEAYNYYIDPTTIHGLKTAVSSIKFHMWVDEDTPSLFPVFVSIAQRHEVLPIQLPYAYVRASTTPKIRYTSATRTLCLVDNPLDENEHYIKIRIATGSTQEIGFHMRTTIVDDLLISENDPKVFSVTPMDQTFVKFAFNENTTENLLVRIRTADVSCLALAIQEPKCPVFHANDNFLPGNNWKVFPGNASIRVNMKQYLQGFFIKTTLLPDDSLCGNWTSNIFRRRHKTFSLEVQKDLPISLTTGAFWFQIAIPPMASLVVAVILGSLYLITYSCSRRRVLACRTYNVNKTDSDDTVSVQKFAGRAEKSESFGKWTIFITLLHALPIIDQALYNFAVSKGNGIYGICSHNSGCAHSLWIFEDFNHLWSNVGYVIFGWLFTLIVCVKKHVCRNGEDGIPYLSSLYYAMGFALIAKGVMSVSYHICPTKANFQYDTIYLAIIFGLCQLKLTELRKPNSVSLHASGGTLVAILIISAVGLMFERFSESGSELPFFVFRITTAVVQGIFILYVAVYAIYIGYPINRFPKLKERDEEPLQSRRIMLAELRPNVQIDSERETLTRRTKLEPRNEIMKSFNDIPRCLWIFPKLWHWKLPKFRVERLLYVLLLLGLNSGLIYYSLTVNYTIYMLLFVTSNFALNIFFYIIMKFVFGEMTCSWKSNQFLFYLVLAMGTIALSAYLFLQNLQEWTEPRAHFKSTEDCLWMKPFPFYDKHDSYHLISAHAFFLLYMVLLSLDDGVEGVGRDYLLVF